MFCLLFLMLLVIVTVAGCGHSNQSQVHAAEDDAIQSTAQRHLARKLLGEVDTSEFPPVLMTDQHRALCQVGVGDKFPKITLPRLAGTEVDLRSLLGSRATVVLFWHPDRWMAMAVLTDLQQDIVAQVSATEVAVVGIAVEHPASAIENLLNDLNVTFPQMLDVGGEAFAAVGTVALPRVYVLDPPGRIVWFDIEYSESTRRELQRSLELLAPRGEVEVAGK